MDLITLGKQCILEAMKVLETASNEIIQFKGPTKNIQIAADISAEESMINILRKSGYDFFIISEEKEKLIKIGSNPEIEVYIDPLDGSSYFPTGNKRLCCTALMFIQGGKVLASFVGDLITGDIYHCDAQSAYFNNQKILFSSEKKGERYVIAVYAIKGKAIKEELPKLVDLAQEEIFVLNNSGPLEQALVATGQRDAAIDLLPVSPWDCCGIAIARKAGAIVTTREGNPFRYENIKQTSIVARNSDLHRMLLNAFN